MPRKPYVYKSEKLKARMASAAEKRKKLAAYREKRKAIKGKGSRKTIAALRSELGVAGRKKTVNKGKYSANKTFALARSIRASSGEKGLNKAGKVMYNMTWRAALKQAKAEIRATTPRVKRVRKKVISNDPALI
jgi:uncharacterized protein YggU (UPF0235/DUF167 family)